MSQADLAHLAKISQQSLSKFERGRLTPSKDVAALLASILGTSVPELFPELVGNHKEAVTL